MSPEEKGFVEANPYVAVIQKVAASAPEVSAHPRKKKHEGKLLELLHAFLPLFLGEAVCLIVRVG